MTQIKITRFDSNPQWDNMELKQTYSEWSISSHPDGVVEIECATNRSSEQLILNQDDLKQLIQFLQEKVI
jgi:hypothetical protein